MKKQIIGENAGLLWLLIKENGELSLDELFKISNIDETDFNRSLGWLARENKIAFYEEKEKQMVCLIY